MWLLLHLQRAVFPQQPASGTTVLTWSFYSASGKVIWVCLSIPYSQLSFHFFSFVFFLFLNKHSSCVCGFRSNHNRSCALQGLTRTDYISSSGSGPLGSHADAFTLCVNFTVSGQFCPNSAAGLLVKINSSTQERMCPFFLPPPLPYPSIYILIALQSTLSLGKQQHNLKLWRSFVKSEEISPDGDGGRVILVPAWKIQAFRLKPLLWKCNRASEWQGLLPGKSPLSSPDGECRRWRVSL